MGQEVIVEQDIAEDDWITYRVYGDGNTLVYQQIITGREISAGDPLIWWFKIPLEGFSGQTVTATMQISKGDRDAPREFLLVRPTEEDTNVRYAKVMRREFSDEDVMSGVLYITAGQTIRYAATYAVDTQGGAITLPVNTNIGYKSFIVFDANQNFNANPCTVRFDNGQGEAVLQTKNDSYLFYYDGNQWRYLDLSSKNGGIV